MKEKQERFKIIITKTIIIVNLFYVALLKNSKTFEDDINKAIVILILIVVNIIIIIIPIILTVTIVIHNPTGY